jgi:hypothetical protein
VSTSSRINVNFAEFWRGRWESNPTLNAAKSLLVGCGGLVSQQPIVVAKNDLRALNKKIRSAVRPSNKIRNKMACWLS